MKHDYVNTNHCDQCYKKYQKQYRADHRDELIKYHRERRDRERQAIVETFTLPAAPLADYYMKRYPLSDVIFAPTK